MNISNKYKELVLNKYHVYNSLFMNLPFERIKNIGMLIPILSSEGRHGLEEGLNPVNIIDSFADRHMKISNDDEKIEFLFRVIQYVERQVVLFDSIEDAAFQEVMKYSDTKTFKQISEIASAKGLDNAFNEKMLDFGIRIVFTAHPTQFYPSSIQKIIQDLRTAISKDSIQDVDLLLQQLGCTTFLNKEKPSPFDEAKSIIYYLRHVYYNAIGTLFEEISNRVPQDTLATNANLIQLGFWPGGDRDGNPYVNATTTLKVANELRMTLMKCYYNELKQIRRRLTFRNVMPNLNTLSNKLYDNMFSMDSEITYDEIYTSLSRAKSILIDEYNGLFVEQLDQLINKLQIFKLHFACLDIRQDSRKHSLVIKAIIEKHKLSDKPYEDIPEEELIRILTQSSILVNEEDYEDELISDTIINIKQLKEIQRRNGEQGANRYIISNSEDQLAVLNVYGLFKFCGWKDEEMTIDIIPLFETINGLSQSETVMKQLYSSPVYSKHLERRKNKQTIMLGFSDGTKDGGYLKANWEIFKAKEKLSNTSEKSGIKAIFFDGRGGPPARGGGKTSRFYAAQGKNISSYELQVTIQGQTVTSMYGTMDQFKHNCEQLIVAGMTNDVFNAEENEFSTAQRELMEDLANISYNKYEELKQHPKFIDYLEKMSTLKYYGMANIGSRPAKRGNSSKLTLSDLRAIAFVGSWSQLKQNVPGYFGIGTALLHYKNSGKLDKIKELFEGQSFFKTLVLNSMMSLNKTLFSLTSYMEDDEEFGEFWKILHSEYVLSKSLLLEITGSAELMEQEPISKISVEFREKMVLPLLIIQQYALQKIAANDSKKEIYEKIVMRSLYGNINASRNSA